MSERDISGDAWVDDMASLVFTVLIIACLCAAFFGLYWMVV